MAIQNRRTRHGVFEISSGNGLIGIYALRRARGSGGKPDPKLEALLADRAQRLKEKQETAKLASSANSKSQLTEAEPPSTELKFQLVTTVDKWPQTLVMVLLILAIVSVSLLMSWL
jgi:cytochrome c-type biogenesis protein CcmH/NrfG